MLQCSHRPEGDVVAAEWESEKASWNTQRGLALSLIISPSPIFREVTIQLCEIVSSPTSHLGWGRGGFIKAFLG